MTAIDRSGQRLRLTDGERAAATTSCCSASAAGRAGSTFPATILPAFTTCARWPTSTRSASTSPGRSKLVVVGAGYIGLEAAASARHLGLDVTVLEMADRPMNRVVAPEISSFYRARHEREGVRILCNASVSSFSGDRSGAGRASAATGNSRPTSSSWASASCRTSTLAASAGLRCENGHLGRRALPHVRPEHLCRRRLHQSSERPLRPSRAARIRRQRRRAGAHCSGEHLRQGRASRTRAVVLVGPVRRQAADRGPLATATTRRSCAAIRIRAASPSTTWREGELLAVDAVNSPKDFMTGKKWIAERQAPRSCATRRPGDRPEDPLTPIRGIR